MTHERLSFLQRLSMAFDAFRRILGDDDFAQRLKPLLDIARSDGEGRTIGADFTESSPNAALQLLSLLQQHGRLVDFLEEEVTSFSDQEVGAAARVVHEGCRDVLRDYLTVAPVREEAEGSRVQIEAGFDPSAVRLTGNLVGEPPFSGRLVHRGWKVTRIELPRVASGHDFSLVAAAEVEL